jgi:hypothetical protein
LSKCAIRRNCTPPSSNFRKHGVSFRLATSVFHDPLAITIFDEERNTAAMRIAGSRWAATPAAGSGGCPYRRGSERSGSAYPHHFGAPLPQRSGRVFCFLERNAMPDLIDEKNAFAQIPPAAQAGLFCRTGVRYEVALDVMGAMISHYAEAIELERSQANPEAAVVTLYQALQTEIRSQRDALDPQDAAQIEAAIRRFGPRARATFAVSDETEQTQRRAEFLHIVGQAAPESSTPDAALQAILAQVGCGAFDADEGVALWRQAAAQRADFH